MLAIYNTATICGHEQPFECSLRLHPQLREVRLLTLSTFDMNIISIQLLDHGEESRLG